ncbi:MAG: hypothetical protein WAK96_10435 [Desulfobaccales bacterium]
MNFSHCSQCGRETAHKRALGIGTLLACLFTGGLWLPILLIYPVRCIHCGTEEGAPAPVESRGAAFQERIFFKRRRAGKRSD